MALTSNCSLFGSINEEGINLAVRHIMRKRPSLFNYGTAFFLKRPELLCEKIDAHPWVIQRHNPLFTVEDPLPLLGTNGAFGLNFCAQLTAAEIDFHPGKVFELPPELGQLPKQHFALHLRACAGIGCPSRRFLGGIDATQLETRSDVREQELQLYLRKAGDKVQRGNEMIFEPPRSEPKLPPIPIPFDELQCFCLDLFAVCHFEITGTEGNQFLRGRLDGLEIVDIRPQGLENSIECYLSTLLQLVIFPRLSIALEKLVFGIPLDITNATVTVSATPISAAVPNNPAIENDQLKVFVDVEVT